jgi:hypothetical protein
MTSVMAPRAIQQSVDTGHESRTCQSFRRIHRDCRSMTCRRTARSRRRGTRYRCDIHGTGSSRRFHIGLPQERVDDRGGGIAVDTRGVPESSYGVIRQPRVASATLRSAVWNNDRQTAGATDAARQTKRNRRQGT